MDQIGHSFPGRVEEYNMGEKFNTGLTRIVRPTSVQGENLERPGCSAAAIKM